MSGSADMTGASPASSDTWSRQGGRPGPDLEAIAAVREQLIEACLPQTPPVRRRELLGSATLPEATLVRLGSQAHRTDAVDELNTSFCREFLQKVIPDEGAALRRGRTDVTGDLARIWCETAHDDGAHA
ncbi:MAG: hypothetical protein J7474_13110, partial [Arthrobacter sp.]|nr:hypothetical protein [Arthrobacter sp.]